MCRLQKELMVLMMSTEKGVSAFPDGENLFKWIGTITGPRDTVISFISYQIINNVVYIYTHIYIYKYIYICIFSFILLGIFWSYL